MFCVILGHLLLKTLQRLVQTHLQYDKSILSFPIIGIPSGKRMSSVNSLTVLPHSPLSGMQHATDPLMSNNKISPMLNNNNLQQLQSCTLSPGRPAPPPYTTPPRSTLLPRAGVGGGGWLRFVALAGVNQASPKTKHRPKPTLVENWETKRENWDQLLKKLGVPS